ncbi:hypothetical protein VZT92_012791 [Zoarces viviparus]|uniref:Uncharacterized protein n=1 Tax=Zoarces viviparus TaxID=48416 RepID=A0AAW1F4N8_ZOAVI
MTPSGYLPTVPPSSLNPRPTGRREKRAPLSYDSDLISTFINPDCTQSKPLHFSPSQDHIIWLFSDM